MKKISKSTFEDFGNIEKVIEILRLISEEFNDNYAIIGGLAVRIYVGEIRKLTPDIDLLVKLEIGEKIFSLFSENLRKNVFCNSVWLVGSVEGVQIDFQIATKDYGKEIIESAETFSIGDFSVRVANPEHLILMKLGVLREKDERDIILLLRHGNLNLEKLLQLVRTYLLRTYLPSETDTLEQFVLMSKLIDGDNYGMDENIWYWRE